MHRLAVKRCVPCAQACPLIRSVTCKQACPDEVCHMPAEHPRHASSQCCGGTLPALCTKYFWALAPTACASSQCCGGALYLLCTPNTTGLVPPPACIISVLWWCSIPPLCTKCHWAHAPPGSTEFPGPLLAPAGTSMALSWHPQAQACSCLHLYDRQRPWPQATSSLVCKSGLRRCVHMHTLTHYQPRTCTHMHPVVLVSHPYVCSSELTSTSAHLIFFTISSRCFFLSLATFCVSPASSRFSISSVSLHRQASPAFSVRDTPIHRSTAPTLPSMSTCMGEHTSLSE